MRRRLQNEAEVIAKKITLELKTNVDFLYPNGISPYVIKKYDEELNMYNLYWDDVFRYCDEEENIKEIVMELQYQLYEDRNYYHDEMSLY